MAAKGRKGRKTKSKLTKNNRVWLSDLPDDILICIISFLPTRESVATSLLSKRWLNLWTSITKLDFCDSNFPDKTQFINFVETAMSLQNRSSLASFSLSCEHLSDERIRNWITSALECNIKDLSLHLISNFFEYILPSVLFSSESLVKLELSLWFSIISVPHSISLPNLKYLKLKAIKFNNDESTKKLLSHPLLEELDIEWCDWALIKSLIVDVPKLRVLKLRQNIWGLAKLPDFVDRKVGFSGDNLEYFGFKGLLGIEFYICGSAMKLKEAEILEDHVKYEENVDILVKPCYNLLIGLSWVRKLTLTEGFLQILKRNPELVDRIPIFKSVTELNIKGYAVRIDSMIIMKIYERCPHLEHLTFLQMLSNSVRGPLLHPIPPCFRTHLKKITIVNHQREFEEDKALEVLLNSTPILKEMILLYTVHCLCNEYKVQKLKAKLNEGPKASKSCRILVVFDYN